MNNKLSDYFLLELNDDEVLDRPYFSVNPEVDEKLAGHQSTNIVLFSGFQGLLPHAYDWDISGVKLPASIIMKNIKNFPDYEEGVSYPNLITNSALNASFLLKNPELIQNREHLQMQYRGCTVDGEPKDSFIPITGLQSIDALKQAVALEGSEELETPVNTISTSFVDKPLGYCELVHYIANTEAKYPPSIMDREFLENSSSDSNLDGDMVSISDDISADNLLVMIQGDFVEGFRPAISEHKLPSTDWIKHFLRKYRNPKYRLIKACDVAEQNLDVFALFSACIVGKPLSSISSHISRGKFTSLSLEKQTQVIVDIKPLLEAISSDV